MYSVFVFCKTQRADEKLKKKKDENTNERKLHQIRKNDGALNFLPAICFTQLYIYGFVCFVVTSNTISSCVCVCVYISRLISCECSFILLALVICFYMNMYFCGNCPIFGCALPLFFRFCSSLSVRFGCVNGSYCVERIFECKITSHAVLFGHICSVFFSIKTSSQEKFMFH